MTQRTRAACGAAMRFALHAATSQGAEMTNRRKAATPDPRRAQRVRRNSRRW